MPRTQNPFETGYVRREVEWFGHPEFDRDGVTFDMTRPEGRVDAYLNIDFQTGDYECPRLKIGGATWMSLTKLEVESMWCPIQYAREGQMVATVGLGMGYFAMRAAQSPDVERVDAYEIDPRVVEFFHQHFAGRPGYRKVNVILGDARETLRGQQYDFLFADPYPTLLGDEVLTDIDLFCGQNDIGLYRFWGFEKVALEYLFSNPDEVPFWDPVIRRFFRHWMRNEQRQGLFRMGLDDEYRDEVMAKMEDWGMV